MSEITSKPDIQGGDWCIAGTRIPARVIREFADAGYTAQKIMEQYSTLSDRQIHAAVAFEQPVSPPIEPIEVTEAMVRAACRAFAMDEHPEYKATPDLLPAMQYEHPIRSALVAALAVRR